MGFLQRSCAFFALSSLMMACAGKPEILGAGDDDDHDKPDSSFVDEDSGTPLDPPPEHEAGTHPTKNQHKACLQTSTSQDADGDGINNDFDNCPCEGDETSQDDFDKDGVGDVCDNCGGVANDEQDDENGNGIGDSCEGNTNSNYD